jgi:hypothetical protein
MKEKMMNLPMNVKDAIAKFLYDYVFQEADYIAWDENKGGDWNDYDSLMETTEVWENDDYIQNHYSDPGSHFPEYAENATYNFETNTVTINVGKVDGLTMIADFDDLELDDFIEMLNNNYGVINGINFVWVE